MRFFYDAEFYEDGERIHLISIAFISEEGQEFYAENSEFDWSIVPDDHWLQENVRPHLHGESAQFYKHEIAAQLSDFITNSGTRLDNELWGYYADYDHVVLAQLFGRMVDMPEGFPWFTMDLKQEAVRLGNPELPKQDSTEHHAGHDARWNRDVWKFLQEYEEANERSEWYG